MSGPIQPRALLFARTQAGSHRIGRRLQQEAANSDRSAVLNTARPTPANRNSQTLKSARAPSEPSYARSGRKKKTIKPTNRTAPMIMATDAIGCLRTCFTPSDCKVFAFDSTSPQAVSVAARTSCIFFCVTRAAPSTIDRAPSLRSSTAATTYSAALSAAFSNAFLFFITSNCQKTRHRENSELPKTYQFQIRCHSQLQNLA
jgi:hypothetical protein